MAELCLSLTLSSDPADRRWGSAQRRSKICAAKAAWAAAARDFQVLKRKAAMASAGGQWKEGKAGFQLAKVVLRESEELIN